ncbi:8-oxoguanine DNA glycosylase OGG fold protein [Streptomyces arboris]|uniref:8-oxoguanine DNA glycosylase OGG fold protein n=1 Tax=Streptomyces arboris TaxID=2600619 RepID=UPI003639BF41
MDQLRRLVDANAQRSQAAVRFRPNTWRPRLEPFEAGHVLDIGKESTSGRRGDRELGRADVTALRSHAGGDPAGLRDLFVAVMIWGSGTTNGRGPRHTYAALSDARLANVLRDTRASVRSGNLEAAYTRFTLNGVGRSFFTKWFAAVDDRGPDADRALILDARVFRSLNALGWTSRAAAGVSHWPTRYAVYVSTMHTWARELGVTAEWLEWLLFDVNGRVHGDEP